MSGGAGKEVLGFGGFGRDVTGPFCPFSSRAQGVQGAQHAENDPKAAPSMCRVGTVCRYFLAGSSAKPVTHHRSSSGVGPAARRERSNCEETDARFQSHYPMAIDTSRSSIFTFSPNHHTHRSEI